MNSKLSHILKLFFFIPIACTLLLLSGCVPSLQMPIETFSKIEKNEGVIIGSIQMKGGEDLLGRKSWELSAKTFETEEECKYIKKRSAYRALFIKPTCPSSEYSIEVIRDGKESHFVAKLPAGEYHFVCLRGLGFSSFLRRTDVHFTVQPNKTVYIGRLLMEFPPETITKLSDIRQTVENDKDLTIKSMEKTYEKLVRNAITNLMVIK